MNNPYDIHSWSRQYREERLQEARKQHLAQKGGSRSTPGSLLLMMVALVVILLASGCGAGVRSVGLEGDYLGQRVTVGMSPPTSWECYTFYSDGTVQLRHNGASTPTDSGSYQGDASGGDIDWDSGRTSYVVSEGGTLRINDLELEPIDGCV